MATLACYLDASFLVALPTPEPFSEQAQHFAEENAASLIVSDFGIAEYASAISRRVRMRQFTRTQARIALSGAATWIGRSVEQVNATPPDIGLATRFLHRLDLPLRTPDAIHIVIAQRLGATLVTFDCATAASATTLATAVMTP